MAGDFLYLVGQPLGVLLITGKDLSQYGKECVYCAFTLTSADKAAQVLPPIVDSVPTEIPTIAREYLLPYREYENIVVFPVGSVLKADSVGHISHCGTVRLVLKIGEKIYQAGQYLEERLSSLHQIAPLR